MSLSHSLDHLTRPLRLSRRSRRVVLLDAPRCGGIDNGRVGEARWQPAPLDDPWPTRG